MEQIKIEFELPKIATWQDKKGFNKLSDKGEPLYIAQDGSETTSQYTEIEQDNDGVMELLRFTNYPALGELPYERKEVIKSIKLLSSTPVIVDDTIKNKVLIELLFSDENFSHTASFTIDGEPDLKLILAEQFNVKDE